MLNPFLAKLKEYIEQPQSESKDDDKLFNFITSGWTGFAFSSNNDSSDDECGQTYLVEDKEDCSTENLELDGLNDNELIIMMGGDWQSPIYIKVTYDDVTKDLKRELVGIFFDHSECSIEKLIPKYGMKLFEYQPNDRSVTSLNETILEYINLKK